MVLVRHGSTSRRDAQAPEGMIDGHANPPLTERGREQAEIVARRLAQESFSALFTTTLRRTAQTAAPLAKRTGLEPGVVADLREIHLGQWEATGLHPDRLATDPIAQRLFTEQRWEVIPGAETSVEFGRRVAAGLERVAQAAERERPAVAFVHGGVIAEACRQATGSDAFAFLNVDNASITRLVRHADGHWMLRSFNDTSHLNGRIPAISDQGTAAEEVQAIQALLGRYAWLVDRGDWDQWAECFTPDGAFVVRGESIEGREAIVDHVRGELAAFRLIRHLGHTAEIELEPGGRSARSRSYFELRAITQRGHDTEALGSYEDRLLRTDQGWQFAQRRAEFDYWTRRDQPWS